MTGTGVRLLSLSYSRIATGHLSALKCIDILFLEEQCQKQNGRSIHIRVLKDLCSTTISHF